MVICALMPCSEGCLDRAQPVFDVAVDILQDCDGILDAMPDRKPDKPPDTVTSAADTAIPCLKRHSLISARRTVCFTTEHRRVSCMLEMHSLHSYMLVMNWGAFDLNLLIVFDAVMQERSVTRAGGRIGLSQPAMSHALAKLRQQFDDLFDVLGRHVAPLGRM